MSGLKGRVLSTNVLALGIFASYRLLLTEDARENLKKATASVVTDVVDVIDRFQVDRGIVMDDYDDLTRHREMINRKWDSL